MKIGIIGAMIEEIALLKEDMKNTNIKIIGGREYNIGQLYNIHAILVFSRWGKVASASTVTTLINLFNIDYLIFTGIAGALSCRLNIGDVVIGENLYQHDMDARPFFKQHEIPLTKKILFETDKNLSTQIKSATDKFLLHDIFKLINKDTLLKFSIDQPRSHFGTIASGDQFIDEKHKFNSILDINPQTYAVEMEGAAIAQVCHEYNIPFTVVRVISDSANQNAAIDCMKFASDIARYYSRGIVRNLFNNHAGLLCQ